MYQSSSRHRGPWNRGSVQGFYVENPLQMRSIDLAASKLLNSRLDDSADLPRQGSLESSSISGSILKTSTGNYWNILECLRELCPKWQSHSTHWTHWTIKNCPPLDSTDFAAGLQQHATNTSHLQTKLVVWPVLIHAQCMSVDTAL